MDVSLSSLPCEDTNSMYVYTNNIQAVCMQTDSRRSQAERREETRRVLLAAARALFAEKGFAETSTPEIVAKAGVTRGALYHHFADKTALFAAVAEAEHAAVAEAIEAAGGTMPDDPVAALLAGSDAFFAGVIRGMRAADRVPATGDMAAGAGALKQPQSLEKIMKAVCGCV